MLYKRNWYETKERYTKWWQQQGVLLYCNPVLRQTPLEVVQLSKSTNDLETIYTDPKYIAQINHYRLAHFDFPADCLPFAYTDWGTVSLAAFLGCNQKFETNTIWYEYCMDSLDEPIIYNANNDAFLKMKSCIRENNIKARNKYLVGGSVLSSGLDTLAAMYPAQELLIDMVIKPSKVLKKLDEIQLAYELVLDNLWEDYLDEYGGSSFANYSLWGIGKTTQLQCEFSAMISPSMISEFVIPYIYKQCDLFDNTMFLIDGTDCLHLVEQLLTIDNLDAIQWMPQYGVESAGNSMWFDLYKKILDNGKSLKLRGVQPNEVIPLIKAIGKEGVFLHIDSNQLSIEEINELYEYVNKY